MSTDRRAGVFDPLKQPAAWLPLLMSLAALAMVLVHWLMYGVVHAQDEGTAAHVFQLLMLAQVPLVGYFAMTWLPRRPGAALSVLSLQAMAALAAVLAVYFLT